MKMTPHTVSPFAVDPSNEPVPIVFDPADYGIKYDQTVLQSIQQPRGPHEGNILS